MKANTSTFFEIVVSNEIVDDKGERKRVTESYVTSAQTFTEAEANTYKHFGVGEDLDIKKITIAPYSNIIHPKYAPEEPRYYKVAVKITVLDDHTMKEKHSKVYHLVEAANIDTARANVYDAYKTTALDYDIVSLIETKILEII